MKLAWKFVLVLMAAAAIGCGQPPCPCGHCNKSAEGICIMCEENHRCTPLGPSPCCATCTCR